jgi:WD40 repeat protein
VCSFDAVGWSPDGRVVATCGLDHVAALWDANGVQEPRLLALAGLNRGNALAFSPSGRTVAVSAVADGRGVSLFETATGMERARYDDDDGGPHAVAFAPDGRRLAICGDKGVIQVRDVTGLHGQQLGKLSAEELTTLCDALGDESKAAYSAVWRLSGSPEQAVSALKERLRPAAAVDAEKVARWIKDLDDDAFAVRQRAGRELEQLGDQVEGALREAAKETTSLEVRLRAQALLAKLDGSGASPDRLRQLRGLEILEQVATPEACELLRVLKKGASTARLTRDAEEILKRLEGR